MRICGKLFHLGSAGCRRGTSSLALASPIHNLSRFNRMAVDRTRKVSVAPQDSAKGVGGLSYAKTAHSRLVGVPRALPKKVSRKTVSVIQATRPTELRMPDRKRVREQALSRLNGVLKFPAEIVRYGRVHSPSRLVSGASCYSKKEKQMANLIIRCDGGADPNPGYGYGSWQVEMNGEFLQKRSRTFLGDPITNNQAEYLILIDCLKTLAGQFPVETALEIYIDAQLVVHQLNGRWKAKHPNIKPLLAECRFLLDEYTWSARWNGRQNNVNLFGH